ncbi:MAG: hemolysin III family protein [Treponema sp.]|nr:hemolysin III family protein [Treponema sp.]
MADISARITRKSLAAKKKAAIKTLKAQNKEKIREVKIQYASNPERLHALEVEKEQKKNLRIQKRNARLAYNSRLPRRYTLGEDLFNSISHGIGAGLSVAAIVLLVLRAVFHAPEGQTSLYVTAFTIFGSTLFIGYMMSTLYHAITPHGARRVFSIIDHISIYLLIGGTYTPFVLTRINGSKAMAIFIAVWCVVLVLSLLYAVFGARLRAFSLITYCIMGWLIITVFSLYTIDEPLSSISKVFLFAGGICYTVGGVFYIMRSHRWAHSVFHVLALAGSILHFFSVYYIIG